MVRMDRLLSVIKDHETDEAIADENYEYAKMYKDEIRRREEEGRSR